MESAHRYFRIGAPLILEWTHQSTGICMPDGEFLRLEYRNGCSACVLCGYCGEDQVKIDGSMVDIRKFAENMERNGIIYGPMRGE